MGHLAQTTTDPKGNTTTKAYDKAGRLCDSAAIPYDLFTPPEYVWGVTYWYEDKSVMESYKEQLRQVGFVDNGAVNDMESFWTYKHDGDGAVFAVEMRVSEKWFTMSMYVHHPEP